MKGRVAAKAGSAVKKLRKRKGAEEPSAERIARARKVLKGLEALYPGARVELDHGSAFELLVATILSAQTTDVNVNKVTPSLFARYPDARTIAGAETADLEEMIHSTGFYRQKTKSIQAACRRIVEAYEGKVPDTMADLVTLPGVARKTANVILGSWFQKVEGIAVDTHVGRLACRLGRTWTRKGEKDAEGIEKHLMALIPKKAWTFFSLAMILHGRRVCRAKKPDCAACRLSKICPSAFSFE